MINRTSRNFLHSPLRYQGHITYALGNVLVHLPEHDTFIEPFCGGSGVFFAKPKSKSNWLNDINSELISTYETIRDNPKEIISTLEGEGASQKRYTYLLDRFKPRNKVEVAARWFFLNRTSKLETMDRIWEQDGRVTFDLEELSKTILESSRKLKDVRLTCGDFERVIVESPEGSFLLVAPPYSLGHSQERTSQYRYPFFKQDHQRLLDALREKSRSIKFMLVFRDSAEIRREYDWCSDIINLEPDNQFIDDPTKKEEDQVKPYSEKPKGEVIITSY